MKQVKAYHGYGIYIDYGGEQENSAVMVLVSNLNLARVVCETLNKRNETWGSYDATDVYNEDESKFLTDEEEIIEKIDSLG